MSLKNYKRSYDNEYIDDKDYIEQALNKYKGYDEDMLITALMQNLRKSKADGTFNEEELDNFVSMIMPNLSHEQQVRLNNVIKIIKSDNAK